MRKQCLAVGIAAAALIPTFAAAQTQQEQQQSSCERQRSMRVVATVGGAGVGGVLGNVIAGQVL